MDVIRLAFRFDTVPRSSVVRVQLRSRSDLYLTVTAEQVSLVPGTIVLEAHRATSTLYLHVLGATDEAAIAAATQGVFAAEERAIRTFGSDAEIAALEAGDPAQSRRCRCRCRCRREIVMVGTIVMAMVAVSAVMLSIAAVLTVSRMSRGPSSLDRVVAADVLVAIVIATAALDIIINDHSTTLPVMLVLALLGFAGSVSIARFVADRDSATRWNVEPEKPPIPGRDAPTDGEGNL